MLKKINNFLAQLIGIDLERFVRAILAAPRFLLDLQKFSKDCSQPLVIKPCLHDSYAQGGTARGEYFWQDLYIARKIFQAQPLKHVDVGSRFDGFVAHVASYRDIEVIDIRPIQTHVPGVTFQRMDMMGDEQAPHNYCDSVSCLHALEHFGLGRYGDPIDTEGHVKGLRNLVRLLKMQGRLYLSVPVGIERVEFNANRVFSPNALLKTAETLGLALESLAWVTPNGESVHESTKPMEDLLSLQQMHYALGIFVFTKVSEPIFSGH